MKPEAPPEPPPPLPAPHALWGDLRATSAPSRLLLRLRCHRLSPTVHLWMTPPSTCGFGLLPAFAPRELPEPGALPAPSVACPFSSPSERALRAGGAALSPRVQPAPGVCRSVGSECAGRSARDAVLTGGYDNSALET